MAHPTAVTQILFATDFHGIQPSYEALVHHTQTRRPDAVVLGGDLLPFPMVGQDPLEAQRDFVESSLRGVFRQIVEAGATVYAIHGNDDWAASLEALERLAADGLVQLIHGRAVSLTEGWSIAGLGLVPITPFYMKDFDRRDHVGWSPAIEPPTLMVSDSGAVRETGLDTIYDRPTLEDELDALARESEPARTVYVVHTPPSDCALDVMHGGQNIGSPALRRFLERHRPPLSLHGHVHESASLTGAIHDRIGDTVSVNPGASALGFTAAWVDLERRTVEHIVNPTDT